MADNPIINIPPMPKPEDFGLKENSDYHSSSGFESTRYKAYQKALEVWERTIEKLAKE